MEINSCILFLEIVVALAAVLVVFLKWKLKYWERRKVPFLPASIPFGNVENPWKAKRHLGFQIKAMYDKIKAENIKGVGIFLFTNPAFLTTDLDFIKNVLTKDFQYFTDRFTFVNEKIDPLTANLVNLNGPKWRKLRTKLTPTFTSGKLKNMFSVLVECEASLQEFMQNEYEKHAPIDIKDVLARFTTDIIGSCAFGLDCGSIKNENSVFRMYGKKVFTPTLSGAMKKFANRVAPNLFQAFRIKTIPEDINDFFMKIVKDTVDYRERTNCVRNDFLQLLINLKNSQNPEDQLTLEEMAAQCFVFFLAGFETSSTTMSFVLYALAKHPEIQKKLRSEVNTVLARYGGKMTYEAMQEMTYMNQVIEESMRLFPPVSFLTRRCVKDYKVPLGDTTILIEKGVQVLIPIVAIHHDKDIYPEPEKFDPERFSEANKATRHNFSHLPFGEGPRICIGMRFGLMQTKVGLAALLKKYEFKVSSKTREPLEMVANALILSVVGEIWLDAKKID